MYIPITSQERFELPTDALEGRCSIQLSYWDMAFLAAKHQRPYSMDVCAPLLKDNFNYRNDLKKSQCYFEKIFERMLFNLQQPFRHRLVEFLQSIAAV
jgi:hypothetical protein